MKYLSFIVLSIILLTIQSCDDDGNIYYANPDKNIAGTVKGDMTLKSGETYNLDGALIVPNGQILRIGPGAKVIAQSKESYIAIAQGGKIYAQGTDDDPIILTSRIKEPGNWGGIVICGKASTNKTSLPTDPGGSLGDRTFSKGTTPIKAEVSDLYYGGYNVDDDNSGIITYVRVEYSGYSYNDEKQFNGFSFFGVGSGTTVNNISSYNSADDGIEFFGGYLNADYIVSIGSGDDGIDFCDGWSGKGNYWYSYNSQKSGIEGSNNETYTDATPTTNANISHITVYKMGEYPWYLKDGAGKQTISDIIIGGLPSNTGEAYFFYKEEDAMIVKNLTYISFSNVKFVGNMGNNSKEIPGLKLAEAETSGAGSYTDTTTYEPDWVKSWAKPAE